MDNTKNVLGNRQVVTCRYMVGDNFKIPEGLDLNDEKVVRSWSVKWRVLTIQYVDGSQLEIVPEPSEYDYKRPLAGSTQIVAAEEEGVIYEGDAQKCSYCGVIFDGDMECRIIAERKHRRDCANVWSRDDVLNYLENGGLGVPPV